MKNMIKAMKNKVTAFCVKAKTKMVAAKENLANVSGDGYVDTAVKIIIGCVVGAVVLAGLYALAKSVTGTMSTTVNGMFDYSGT